MHKLNIFEFNAIGADYLIRTMLVKMCVKFPCCKSCPLDSTDICEGSWHNFSIREKYNLYLKLFVTINNISIGVPLWN